MAANSSGDNFNTSARGRSAVYHPWTVIPTVALTVLVISVPLNSAILYLFARHRHLRTGFTVYLMNLLAANLLSVLIQIPIYLTANRLPYWWIGGPACTAYIYGYIIQSGMCNAHALISVNRLWAVCRPLSYRRLHSQRTAWLFCLLMWVYVHSLTLPGVVDDARFYRLPEPIYGCIVNKAAQPGWAFPHQFIVFTLPAVVVFFTYPFICYQMWNRKRFLRVQVAPHSLPSSRAEAMPLAVITIKVTGVDNALVAFDPDPSVGEPANTDRPADVGPLAVDTVRQKPRAFVLLTCLTLGMLVFWVPSIVFYTAIMFREVDWRPLQQIATVLWFLEAVIDPVLFTFALGDLRKAVGAAFGCRLP
ncbi:hypothetical protein BV898_12363 [Hypsibius exemplaris]|uniref:G-protein coupled receptors family 1 profile domain-containing protein n=1 Tax=Hypsibius exemplaris TaxID=2072580 RepID=A0A1W0WDX5_HYPEX|nr:hypothetical protein BV898_12363 [Hypsibius exemplaris]